VGVRVDVAVSVGVGITAGADMHAEMPMQVIASNVRKREMGNLTNTPASENKRELPV
jgi:hypothetical protein